MNPRTRGFRTCWDIRTPLEGEGMSSIWNWELNIGVSG